jgi:hypothetical protein
MVVSKGRVKKEKRQKKLASKMLPSEPAEKIVKKRKVKEKPQKESVATTPRSLWVSSVAPCRSLAFT